MATHRRPAERPLPPIVIVDEPERPISPRQRAAWWAVAADLQRFAAQEQQHAPPAAQEADA